MRLNLLLSFIMAININALAQQTTGLFQYDWQAQDGFTLFAPLLAGHNQYLLNNCGEVVHSWNSPLTAPANSMYLLEDGNMMYPARADSASSNPINGGGAGERIILKDWDGNVLWDYIYYDDLHRLHHDIEPMPNGNVLAIAWVSVDSADCVAAGRDPELISQGVLWSERIIEVEPTGPTTGNIVWQWDLMDHLVQDFDATKDNYGVVQDHPELLDMNYINTFLPDPARNDWIHLNSIDYNADLDQIVLSSQVLSEIWIIDHSTTTNEASGHTGGNYGRGGDFLYRYGNPQVYDRGTENDQILWRQHDANWIPEGYENGGAIMIYNNGLDRIPGFSEVDVILPPQSTPGVYEISAGQPFGPSSKEWTYHAPDSVSFNSYFISGARRLPNGNTIICEGESGHFFEVNLQGEVVWDYVNPEAQWSILSSTEEIPLGGGGSFHSNMVFRAERYTADYPAFVGKDLGTGVQLEANPILASCIVGVESFAGNQFSVYPNPTTGSVTLETLTGAVVSIFTIDGRLISSRRVMSDKEVLDMSRNSKGMYVLRIDLNGDSVSRKLILQ